MGRLISATRLIHGPRNKEPCSQLCPLSTSFGVGAMSSQAPNMQSVQPWRRLPSFYQPSDYYDPCTFPGDIKHPYRELAYECKQAARHGDGGLRGRKSGELAVDAMSGAYLTSLPRKFMWKLAGEGYLFLLWNPGADPVDTARG
jgi:hypothetical protein